MEKLQPMEGTVYLTVAEYLPNSNLTAEEQWAFENDAFSSTVWTRQPRSFLGEWEFRALDDEAHVQEVRDAIKKHPKVVKHIIVHLFKCRESEVYDLKHLME